MSEKRSMASVIVDEVLSSKAVTFVDQYGNTQIAIEGDGNNVCEINSSTCRHWITDLSYELLDHVPSTAIENQVIKVLEAKARRGGNCFNLEICISRYRNAVWYDLGSGAVRITNKNWGIVKKPPIIFRKPANQQQQVKPKHGGDVKSLLRFVNITNESEQLLFLCYVVAAFIPDIQHPVLVLHGTHGAGKSTPMHIVKSLVDHTAIDMGSNLPKDEDALALNAYDNYTLFFDNLSPAAMTEKLSDALSKAVTGSGFRTRRLFTNSEVFAFKFKRIVILNGISQIVGKPDLLDRSLVMQLERITDDKRIEDSVLQAEYEAAKPQILGAILDTLVKAIVEYPKVKPKQWSRMADFDHWGCAIAEALGYGQERFMEARNGNTKLQHDYAIEASPVAQCLITFMEDKAEWVGTASKLYGALEPIAEKLHLERSNVWPKDAARLKIALNSLTTNLQAKGLGMKSWRDKERMLKIYRLTDASDGTDSKNG